MAAVLVLLSVLVLVSFLSSGVVALMAVSGRLHERRLAAECVQAAERLLGFAAARAL